jgi:hypothetical protein
MVARAGCKGWLQGLVARDGCKGYVLYVSVRMYYREGKREQRDAKAQITRERSVQYFEDATQILCA